jgi:hypothetical protein
MGMMGMMRESFENAQEGLGTSENLARLVLA